MKKNAGFYFFFLVLVADCIAIQLGDRQLQYVFKPLIVVSLVLYFLANTKNTETGLKKWIIAALFFSWAGDCLLLFEEKDKLFFLSGLSAFLLAHIFYIIFFHTIRVRENIRANGWFLLVVVLYYAVLIWFLTPYLGDMKIPVRIYGIVISFMFMLAMHMPSLKNKMAGNYMMGGALLFVVSDSVLAVNKFYRELEGAGIVIMLTYGLAQLLITIGAIRYIRGKHLVIT